MNVEKEFRRRRMPSKLLSLLAPILALMLTPAALRAQETQTPQARIDAALETATQSQIPVSLLTSKVAEGEAKRVPPDRIATAVEARLTALVSAAATLRRAQIQMQSEAELSVTADALLAGVVESAVVRMLRNAPQERRVVAIALLTDLVRLGQDSEPAFVRVNAALNTNAALANLNAEVVTHAALANLQAEVASRLRLEGLPPTLIVPMGQIRD